jgi:hypothetical protein
MGFLNQGPHRAPQFFPRRKADGLGWANLGTSIAADNAVERLDHVGAILHLIPHENVVLAKLDTFLVSDAGVEVYLREPGDFFSRHSGLHTDLLCLYMAMQISFQADRCPVYLSFHLRFNELIGRSDPDQPGTPGEVGKLAQVGGENPRSQCLGVIGRGAVE